MAVQAIGSKWAKSSRDGAAGAGLQLASPMALGLTDKRVVVFTGKTSGMSGKLTEVTGLVSAAPVADVEEIEVKRLLVGKTVHIHLHGGEVKLEVAPGQGDPKAFAAEFTRIKAGG
jgi:hypothetical protein